MNELRVARLLRELRCEPAAQWLEALFGIGQPAAAPVPEPQPVPETPPATLEDGSEIESWLM
jgi:hypothetical protein